jgi:hypothetical protein
MNKKLSPISIRLVLLESLILLILRVDGVALALVHPFTQTHSHTQVRRRHREFNQNIFHETSIETR